MKKHITKLLWATLFLSFSIFSFAHCDTRNGPVVKAAAKALQTGNIKLVLIWVQPKFEAELRKAFDQTRTIRTNSKIVQQLADNYFFETTVRLHRMGEGESYTGIQDGPPETFVLGVEKALQRRSADSLLLELNTSLAQNLARYFEAARTATNYDSNDVRAGREYVAQYIQLLHYVEGVHKAITKQAESHNQHKPDLSSLIQQGRHQLPSVPSAFSLLGYPITTLGILGLLIMIVFLGTNTHKKPLA